jgi:hypothetical protein
MTQQEADEEEADSLDNDQEAAPYNDSELHGHGQSGFELQEIKEEEDEDAV